MSWSYRVVRRVWPRHQETTFAIHEAYSHADGRVHSLSIDPIEPYAETLDELRDDMARMIAALNRPVLDYETLAEVDG